MRLRLFALSAVLLLVAAACSPWYFNNGTASDKPADDRVLMSGDSILNSAADELAAALDQTGWFYNIQSTPGQTAAEAITATTPMIANEFPPDIVIAALGTNDVGQCFNDPACDHTDPSVADDVAKFWSNVDTSHPHPNPCMIGVTIVFDPGLWGHVNQTLFDLETSGQITAVADWQAHTATEYAAFLAGQPQDIFADGVGHLTPNGQQVFADFLLDLFDSAGDPCWDVDPCAHPQQLPASGDITAPGIYTGTAERVRVRADYVTLCQVTIDPGAQASSLDWGLVVNNAFPGDNGVASVTGFRSYDLTISNVWQNGIRIYGNVTDAELWNTHIDSTGLAGEFGSAVYIGQGGDFADPTNDIRLYGGSITDVNFGSALMVKPGISNVDFTGFTIDDVTTVYGGALNLATDKGWDWQGLDPDLYVDNTTINNTRPAPGNFGGYGVSIGEDTGVYVNGVAVTNGTNADVLVPEDASNGVGINVGGLPSFWSPCSLSTEIHAGRTAACI